MIREAWVYPPPQPAGRHRLDNKQVDADQTQEEHISAVNLLRFLLPGNVYRVINVEASVVQ